MLGGFKCYGPAKIGAGYRKRIELEKSRSMIDSETWPKIMAEIAKSAPKPKGLPEDAWRQQILEQALEKLTVTFDVTEAWKADLCVLKTLLVPEDGAPSIEQLYLEFAEESEVQAVLNFSVGLASDKIETEPLTPISGEGMKPKAAVRSRNTSRPPSLD